MLKPAQSQRECLHRKRARAQARFVATQSGWSFQAAGLDKTCDTPREIVGTVLFQRGGVEQESSATGAFAANSGGVSVWALEGLWAGRALPQNGSIWHQQ